MRLSLFLVLLLAAATPAIAAERRVARIDSLLASQKGNVILLQAKGAVASGGWSRPRLHVLHNDGNSLQVEFVASPPPAGMTVIKVVVPVAAGAEVRGRAASVHVMAEENEITSQVLH